MSAKHHTSTSFQWTETDVANQFEEAVSTLKKLPPVRVQGYFSLWPEGVYSLQDLLGQEIQPIRLTATPVAITRLEQTLGWMPWLTVEERKLLWWRAAGVRWKVICFKLGCGRTTVWRNWVMALSKVANRLNGMAEISAPTNDVVDGLRMHEDVL